MTNRYVRPNDNINDRSGTKGKTYAKIRKIWESYDYNMHNKKKPRKPRGLPKVTDKAMD